MARQALPVCKKNSRLLYHPAILSSDFLALDIQSVSHQHNLPFLTVHEHFARRVPATILMDWNAMRGTWG